MLPYNLYNLEELSTTPGRVVRDSFDGGETGMGEGDKDVRPVGRDEMNLAEYPITLLSDRPDRAKKTLVFEGEHGRLTVTGSDAYGLPTAPDGDVIVGLIQLTKLRNDFTNPTVPFTRYELLKLLQWPDQGRHYRRLDEALNRWVGVMLCYEKAWWDNAIKCRVDAKFHIIESVVIYDQEVRRTLQSRHQPLPLSSFTWNNLFFASCRADNLKRLDLAIYFGLKSAVSRQLYRFLDKRFYRGPDWTFDLRELAFEHVGLSRSYTAAKIKEKLQPALEELEAIGFLKPATAADRYVPLGRGEWRIRLARRAGPALPIRPVAEPGPRGLERELVDRGVTRAVAAELVRDYPEGRIAAQIERADWLRRKRPQKIGDLGAYLVGAVRDDYAAPAGFEPEPERRRREQDERQRQHRQAEAKAHEREQGARVAAYWDGLTPDQQARLEADAWAAADPATRAGAETGPPAMRRNPGRLGR